MKKIKVMSLCLSAILSFSIMGISTRAADLENREVKTADEIKERFTTTVTIEDIKTGEITSYELDKSLMEVSASTPENPNVTVIVDTGKGVRSRASQTNSNTISGWKGNVRISWSDDGTFARLTSAGGDWTRVSGSASMTNRNIRYGQSLGTNSRSGSSSFTNSYNVSPGWSSGKYGKGHWLGANIGGIINGKMVYISCNYNLY